MAKEHLLGKTSEELKELAFSHWDLVNSLANKRFARDVTAEEAAFYVLNTLEKDNWQKLTQFRGQSKFTTYFSSIVFRLLEDYSRKKFGRVTAPRWVTQLGRVWIQLFKLLCLERFSFNESLEIAQQRNSDIPQDTIEKAAEKILGDIPHCGKPSGDYANTDSDYENVSDQHTRDYEELNRKNMIEALAVTLFNEQNGDQEQIISRFMNHNIKLAAQERLFLRLCYQDGFSVTKAGNMLGLNRFQAHGRMRRLLKKIRSHFEESGLSEELTLLLKDKETLN